METKTDPKNTVYISNLSYERDRNGIRSLFSKFGIIKEIKIIVEPRTNQSRGMAFVQMGSNAEAAKAIASLNNTVIDGRTVKARYATPMKGEAKPFYPAKSAEKKVKKVQKDLDFTTVQLQKKARNEAKRKSNPLVFKVAKKKSK